MRALLIYIFISAVLDLFGQQTGSVSGVVKSNEGSIPGATIKIIGTNQGAISDPNGKYEISGLSQSVYKLEVRSVGFKPQIIQIDLTEITMQLVDIVLQESVLDMNEVVITGTMQPTFVTQSPVKVQVMTSEHINTYMPAAASGIVESIALVGGVQEVVSCGVCFTNSISINGLPGPYTAILMDGTPIYGNLASVYGLNGIPSMIIDRIEVIKGPNSTLYGSEAVAGVINIITKNPETQPKFSMDIMGTSHMESFGNFATSAKLKKATGFIGLNYAYIYDFDDVNQDGFGDMANLDRISIFTKWDVIRDSGKPFSVSAKYYFEDRRNGVEEFITNRNYRKLRGHDEIYGESIYTHRTEVFGTYGFDIREKLKLDYSFSSHFQNSYYGSDYYKANQQIFYANLIWEKNLANHSLLTGLTNRYQIYDDNTIATEVTIEGVKTNKSDDQYIPGLFIQDEWKLTSGFSILAGLRADHYQSHGTIWSPRLSTKNKIGQWTTFRSNFGTGFRIVNLFTEDHAFLSGQREVIINEALLPERSYNGSLNLNHIFTLGASQGSIDVDAFYTYFTNKIIPNYDDPNLIVYENTNGYAVTKGLSLSVSQEFEFPFSINLGFNFQNVTESETNDRGVFETRDIEFAPKWTSVFTGNYQLKKWALTIAYTSNITGPMTLPEVYDLDGNGDAISSARPTKSPTFMIHNLQLNKKIKKNFSCYAGVQNIFNYTQRFSPLVGYNDPNANPGFSPSFDTSYTFAPIHGREFYVGLNFSIK